MNDLQHDLYQENILDHAHNPRNYEPTPSALRAAPRGEPLNSKRPWGRGTNANAFGAEVLPLREDLGGGELGEVCICGEGDNPSCGDEGMMCVNLTPHPSPKESGTIQHSIVQSVKWNGRGCAISQASMSIMSEYIKGKSLKELKLLMPGDVYALLGINITPSRVNCALLSYRAVEKILSKSNPHP